MFSLKHMKKHTAIRNMKKHTAIRNMKKACTVAKTLPKITKSFLFHAVYICDKNIYDIKLDINRKSSFMHIKDNIESRGGAMYISGPNWENWNDNETLDDNLKSLFPMVPYFDFILMYINSGDVKGCLESENVTIATFNELFTNDKIENVLNLKLTYAILHHTNEIESLQHVNTYHIHHCADHMLYKLGSNKLYDFVLVGNLTKHVYPLRFRMTKLMKVLQSRGYKCHIHGHPGYKVTSPKKETLAYAKIIQQGKVVISCSSTYKYRLSKYAEIPLCGSAMAGDIPHDGKSFFREAIIEIDDSWDDITILNALVQGLHNWKHYSINGRDMTLHTSTQCHYARRFLNIYDMHLHRPTILEKDIVKIDTLDLRKTSHTRGRHCWWIPSLKLKVPNQKYGMMQKIDESTQTSLSSLAMEYTILKYCATKGVSPPVGDIVVIKYLTYPDGSNETNVYCYFMDDANKHSSGPIRSETDAMNFIASSPIRGTKSSITDFVNPKNIINGYFVDARRSGHDMYGWGDISSMYCIHGVNLLKRRILLVCDVPGWAWDNKARSIQKYLGSNDIVDICYNSEPYHSRLKHYDHVHFFSLPAALSHCVSCPDDSFSISTTIASTEYEVKPHGKHITEKLKNVNVVSVAPVLTSILNTNGIGKRIITCCNGVDHTVFVPGERPTPLKDKIKVLICTKFNITDVDIHGVAIAEKVFELLQNNNDIEVTMHRATYKRKFSRDEMVKLYQSHDIKIHTGRGYLGTPNMIFEAASCGLVIVSTRNGCVPDLIEEEGDVGYTVTIPTLYPEGEKDMETARNIVTCCENLAKDRQKLIQMKKAARQRIEDKWTWEKLAPNYQEVFYSF